MNACDAVQDLLTSHILSALEPSEETLVRDHLEGCGFCRSAKVETEACVACVEAQPVLAPSRVWATIRLKLDRESADDPVRDTDPSPVISLSCSFCRGGMTRTAAVYCASCLAPHHPECFQEHGRCSVMGCAEVRIVRPSELPPLQIHEGGQQPQTSRPRRLRRWFLSGLSLVALGAGAAALTQNDARDALPPQWEARPALDLRTHYRLEAEQVTLEEVCAAIRRLPGEPSLTLPSECRELLLRRVSIEGVHWSEALARIVDTFGLDIVEDGKGWRIDRPAGFDLKALERAKGDLLELDTTRIVDLKPASERDARIYQGWQHTVHVGPRGRSLAVLEGRKLSLFKGTDRMGGATLDAACSDVSWSPDGSRLAYTVGGRESGQLGVFDLSGERSAPSLVRSFPGLNPGARLAWRRSDERILLKTKADLKLVSTLIGGQVITLRSPSPIGYGRFDLLPLGDDRFLILYPDGIEAWQIGQGSPTPLYPHRVAFPPGYRVLPPTRDGKAVVLTEVWALLLDTTTGLYSKLEQYDGEGVFEVDLDPSGTTVAYLKQHEDAEFEELTIRRLADGSLRSLDPGRGVVQGFRWASDGPLIAFWTEDSVFVESTDRRRGVPRKVQTYPETRVLDVQWLSLPGPKPRGKIGPVLVITTRGLALRKAEVSVEEQVD